MALQPDKTNEAHFGQVRQLIFAPNFEEVMSLGEDDYILNSFLIPDLSLSSGHQLDKLRDISVRDFCFVNGNLVVAGESGDIVQFAWPECDAQKVLCETGSPIQLLCGSSVLFFVTGREVFRLDKGHYESVFSSEFDIMWIAHERKHGHLIVFTKNGGLSVLSETGEKVNEWRVLQNEICKPCIGAKGIIFVADQDGVRVFKPHSGKEAKISVSDQEGSIVALAAAGSYIATANTNGEIVVRQYSQLHFANTEPTNAEEIHIERRLQAEAGSTLVSVTFGGQFLAAGDVDGRIYLWQNAVSEPEKPVETSIHMETSKPKNIVRRKTDDIMAALSRPVVAKPKKREASDEELSLSDHEDEPVRPFVKQADESHRAALSRLPKKKATTPRTKKTKLKKLKASSFAEDEAELEYESEDMGSDLEEEESVAEPEPVAEPLVEERLFLEDESEENSEADHEIDIEPYLTDEQREKLRQRQKENEPDEDIVEESSTSSSEEADMAELYPDITFPFMPGSCDTFVGNRRYMCWNEYAAVLLRNTADGSVFDVHKTDGTVQTIPNLGYSMATIDEYGLLLASDSEVTYRHHKTWAPDSMTNVSLGRTGEKIRLVACGEEWFALATDLPAVRIFTSGGLEIGFFELPAGCTVMTGRDNYLFYAYGSSLRFSVVDVKSYREIVSGTLPVKQPLKWVAIGADYSVVCQDHWNIIHKLSRDFSWQWVPVANLETSFDYDTTDFWPVSAGETALYGVYLRGTKSPATNPIPGVRMVELHPVTVDKKMRPWLERIMNGSIIRRDQKARADGELLKLFPEAVNEDARLQAFQIAELMRSKKVRDFVVTFADNHRAVDVADRLTGSELKPKQKKPAVAFDVTQIRNARASKKLHRTSSEETLVYVRKEEDEEPPKIVEQAPTGFTSLMEAFKEIGNKRPMFDVQSEAPAGGGRPKGKQPERNAPKTKKGARKKLGDASQFRPLFS